MRSDQFLGTPVGHIMSNSSGGADISLGNVPVIIDAVNNVVMIVLAAIGGALHISGAPLFSEIAAWAGAAASALVSSIHVGAATWIGGVLASVAQSPVSTSQTTAKAS